MILLVVATVSAGCSSGPTRSDWGLADAGHSPPVDAKEAYEAETFTAVEARRSQELLVPAGMYEWDPGGGFHDSVWSGDLVVEHPCIYLDVENTGSSGHDGAVPASHDELIRSYVRLPEPLTRYDLSTGQIWVGDYGPMSTGDDVVLVGSAGWQQRWHQPGEHTHDFEWSMHTGTNSYIPVCTAHRSFWAASMMPSGTELQNIPHRTELLGLGLFPWDPTLVTPDEGLEGGLLIIEPPCVYYVRLTRAIAPWDEHIAEPVRFFLHLARPLVRFDADDGMLWYGRHGPFTTGDRVIMGGWELSDTNPADSFLEAGCSAEGQFWGIHMEPCDSPSKAAFCAS